jgi:hypothetical protein
MTIAPGAGDKYTDARPHLRRPPSGAGRALPLTPTSEGSRQIGSGAGPSRRCLSARCLESAVLTASNVILTLKIAVIAVTILLIASLVALLRGRYKLHGRINVVFFVLTLVAVLGLEVLIRFVDEKLFAAVPWESLRVHLCFSVPAFVLMIGMLVTGLLRRRRVHLTLAVLFAVAWVGTFVTGVFFLPVKS